MSKPRVAVVFGGRNSEHAVSLMGAGSVLKAIDSTKYEVIPIGIAQDGRWVLAAGDQRYAIEGGELPEVDTSGAALALPSGESSLVAFEPGAIPVELGTVDVVFPVMHGPFAEDGTIQGLLEMAGVRYVGSGVLASAVGMDKAYMKMVLAAEGLPVGPYVVVRERDWRLDRVRLGEGQQSLCVRDRVGAARPPGRRSAAGHQPTGLVTRWAACCRGPRRGQRDPLARR